MFFVYGQCSSEVRVALADSVPHMNSLLKWQHWFVVIGATGIQSSVWFTVWGKLCLVGKPHFLEHPSSLGMKWMPVLTLHRAKATKTDFSGRLMAERNGQGHLLSRGWTLTAPSLITILSLYMLCYIRKPPLVRRHKVFKFLCTVVNIIVQNQSNLSIPHPALKLSTGAKPGPRWKSPQHANTKFGEEKKLLLCLKRLIFLCDEWIANFTLRCGHPVNVVCLPFKILFFLLHYPHKNDQMEWKRPKVHSLTGLCVVKECRAHLD